MPHWPEKKKKTPRTFDLEKRSCLAHTPVIFSVRKALFLLLKETVHLDNWEFLSWEFWGGSREGAVVWDPPFMHRG